ncbi:MAG: class I SAM-dependent methyltransferase [archaeon]|nr:class I SAM-dependent methyltransferase [archaeon]
MFFFVEKCRICGSKDLKKYLNLGQMPLANNLVDVKSNKSDLFFPLEVLFCKKCFLSQLSAVVEPETLFSNYSYRTSISDTFIKHFSAFSLEVQKIFPDTKNCLVLDIASNDGCLLQEFKKKGFPVLGVEPAKNIAEIAESEGIETIVEFWGESAVKKVLQKKQKPQVITATNVFAHVDDIHSFVSDVKKVLSPDGIFIIEVPYALNLIMKNEFDTIYHEHLSYFLVRPLLTLFEMEKLDVFDIQDIPIHGGSIRVFVKFPQNNGIKTMHQNIRKFVEKEEKNGLYFLDAYKKFSFRVLKSKIDFLELLLELKKDGKKIAGYGAAAKASTLLNYCGIGTEYIEFICDDSPLKQGKAFAGNHIPIIPSNALEKTKPDYLVLFAWTIAKELITKTKEFQSYGKYIIPLPRAKIILDEKNL